MKTTMLSVAALGALMAVAVGPHPALAEEPFELNAAQMDEVTAGVITTDKLIIINHGFREVDTNGNVIGIIGVGDPRDIFLNLLTKGKEVIK